MVVLPNPLSSLLDLLSLIRMITVDALQHPCGLHEAEEETSNRTYDPFPVSNPTVFPNIMLDIPHTSSISTPRDRHSGRPKWFYK